MQATIRRTRQLESSCPGTQLAKIFTNWSAQRVESQDRSGSVTPPLNIPRFRPRFLRPTTRL